LAMRIPAEAGRERPCGLSGSGLPRPLGPRASGVVPSLPPVRGQRVGGRAGEPAPSGRPGTCPGRASMTLSRGLRSDSRGTVPGAAPLERAPLVFAHAAPDTCVLAALQRPAQALRNDRAAPADGLRLLDLQQSRTGVPDGEEQLRVLVTAEGAVAPVHRSTPLIRVSYVRADLPGTTSARDCESFHE